MYRLKKRKLNFFCVKKESLLALNGELIYAVQSPCFLVLFCLGYSMSSEKIEIHVESRNTSSKGAVRKLRLNGTVPGVIYNKGSSTQINVPVAGLPKGHTGAKIVELVLNGNKKSALMREVQVNPLTDKPMHFDFQEVSQNDKVSVSIPLRFVGLTREQEKEGTFSIRVRSLEIKSLVSKIPQFIDVDVSKLKGGESVQLFDLNLPKDLVVRTGKGKNVALASIVKI